MPPRFDRASVDNQSRASFVMRATGDGCQPSCVSPQLSAGTGKPALIDLRQHQIVAVRDRPLLRKGRRTHGAVAGVVGI